MFTTAWKGISAFLNVGGIPGRLVRTESQYICADGPKHAKFKGITYNQSSSLSCVNLNRNSSMMRSMPMVRLSSSIDVSTEFKNMKFWR